MRACRKSDVHRGGSRQYRVAQLSGQRTRTASRSFCAVVLWLLLASVFVTILVPRLPPARGFQDGGQLAATVIGQANFTSNAVSRDPGSLYRPFRPAFDSAGNLWVADENNRRVVEFKPPFTDGEVASIEIGQPSFASSVPAPSQNTLFGPVALAFDPSGDLWVADFHTNRTLEFTPPFYDGMNASLELGQQAGANQFTSATASSSAGGLHSPVALTFDRTGNLWVVDRLNNRVLEFRPPFVDGESASQVIGQSNFSSSNASTTRSGLNAPESIAFDGSGNLWVVDQRNNRILEFVSSSLQASGPDAVLEIGQPAGPNQFETNASATSQSALNAPVGIAFDPSGDLLVADRVNNRVLGFEPPFADGMNASFEIGQPGGPGQFTTDVAAVSQSSLHNPLGIAFDASGNLWLADQLNGRVLEFSGPAIATAAATSVPAGGAASVDETPTTRIKMSVIGMAPGSVVNFYSAVLESQPPNTGTPGLASPISFYHAKISGQGGGETTLCVGDSLASKSTGLKFYDGAKWMEPTAVNTTSGVSICGTVPSSTISSLTLVAIGDASGASPSFPTLQVAGLLAAAGIFGAVTYAMRMRRRPR